VLVVLVLLLHCTADWYGRRGCNGRAGHDIGAVVVGLACEGALL
jgi:hypothetical protein